ncbi:glycosyltransferase involved in cell wall biosynthesis [Bacteroides reticulotermitis]|uniref:Glycosyltransferase involved in cell wall biosynthesis n=1 Tax=Bacteroides reticulotermitis TaxID=1133319 RepID=A0A840CY54_9BACE|nr:glycosyltransferase family 4 protein [Bacteroides reticulotermitis]MBB4044810.1 glycosyltransferase involved in cell wall biosynthesis [Bacteroides reticulotermitis]
MKTLFLIFHGFSQASGISKKIHYQVKGLRACGADVRVCWLDDTDNHKRRMIDNAILEDYGSGLKGKIRKRTGLDCIYRYAVEEGIEWVYARCDHNTTPFLINLYRKLQRKGIKVIMEIPTYPYDQEYKSLPLPYQYILFMDKCLRGTMARYIDKIVTFSDHKTIFGRPTIRIANGIDPDEIPLKKTLPDAPLNELHLIAIATIHPWHGFDRAIRGLANYYQQSPSPTLRIMLHIVGVGVPEVVDEYHRLVKENNLVEYVHFHGAMFGSDLDTLFDHCQMGIGSLARHRSGITHLRSLKNREYAVRGIPFVYSETDSDFDIQPYVWRVPADESPLDMNELARFRESVHLSPEEIRRSIEQSLSWKSQMQQVIDQL